MKTMRRFAVLMAAAAALAAHAGAQGGQDGERPRRSSVAIDAPGSVPYACHFGRFTVARHASKAGRFSVTGFGALVSGGEVRHPVGANDEIPYDFAPESGVADGSQLSVYCSTGYRQPDGSFKVAFTVGLGR